MNAPLCQRWRDRRDSYRPAGEPIATRLYEVAEIESDGSDTIARTFVERHHYSGSYPAARARFGLYRSGELVGVSVLSQPPSQAALDAALPFGGNRVELGRLVLLDDVPANGESWFLARCFELARHDGFEALVAHSDPEPRANADGVLVFPGHLGTIYQATNAVYCGRTPARTWRLLPDGTVLSARMLSKLRLRERGWRYGVELLLEHGAPEQRLGEDWRAWVTRAVHAVSRTYRHRGNHRYVWALQRSARRFLPPAQAYPKWPGSVSPPVAEADVAANARAA